MLSFDVPSKNDREGRFNSFTLQLLWELLYVVSTLDELSWQNRLVVVVMTDKSQLKSLYSHPTDSYSHCQNSYSRTGTVVT